FHRTCRDGSLPQVSDLASMTKSIERRHKRRRIPKVEMIDWFRGVPNDLKERAKGRREKFGKTSVETVNHFRRVSSRTC
ncbi:hypothetical protein PENTCL1PPCAC_14014, partial [Pristionchus entomophagus]